MKVFFARIIRNKRAISVLIPIILITIFLLSLQVKSGVSEIATYTVHRGDFVIDIPSRGELDAASQVIVNVPDNVSGNIRITKLVEDGSMVEEGGFLALFDTSEAAQRVIDRQNDLDNANADIAATKAGIESNMKQLESALKTQEYTYAQSKLRFEMMKYEAEAKRRDEELNFKQQELALQRAQERIDLQKIIDERDIEKAEVRVKQAEVRFYDATDQLNALTLKAPRAGLVVLQEVFNFSTRSRDKVKVGDQPPRGMPIISIPNLSVMLVKTKVNEVDVSRVQVGQKVVITFDALPGSIYYGAVTYVATLARRDEGSDVKVFDVSVTIGDKDVRLKPGMTAQCTIITGRVPDQLFIPLDCVFEKNDTTVVYIKGTGFNQQPVKVGKKNSDYAIIENGLKEGEKVALRDPTVPLEEIGTKKGTVATTNLSGNNNTR